MKHVITYLKAPWPLGARVGDVIELDHVPAWAVGKCSPAADDAEVTVSFAPALVVNVPPDAEAEAKAKADAEAEAAKAAEAARAAMEAEAKALGVEFRSNLSDEKLAERIAEAKAKAKQ
jgi:hypothetical protein